MEYSPTFIRIRAFVFSGIAFIACLWIVGLCVALYLQWTILDISERSLVLTMLVSHILTNVMLLILLLLDFRPWLDVARILFLLISQLGTAGAFAYFYPGFGCLKRDIQQEGICTFTISFILIGSWFIPILLIAYIFGLTFMVWRYHPKAQKFSNTTDEESATIHHATAVNLTSEHQIAGICNDSSDIRHFSNFASNRDSRSPKLILPVEHDQVKVAASVRLSKASPILHL